MLRRLNDALPGLVYGILIYGVAVELIGVWFVSDKLRFTTGLCIGIAVACGMAINMAIVLRDATDTLGENRAQMKIIMKSVLRYLIVVVVFFVMMKFDLGNIYSAFIGVIGLKVSAYLQPAAHKFIAKEVKE
jgi:ABC-type polysaccharide transport system permease subunit